ncbi:MAG: YpdA family putative bacillithiol disulfide reductase [Trueperaceae bacterium]|nr:YpdA family putative bacillithiol disulfide reductase [Trueperaceae bacterium]
MPQPTPTLDAVIVGAGPIGLEAAIRAKRAGLRAVVLEQGAIANAIVHYPTYMTFFTTSERLEVGGHPFVTATDKATRKEALDYYRKVVANEGLDVRTFTRVTALRRTADGFEVDATPEGGAPTTLRARAVLVATGYFDHPKPLEVPGADLPHVSHRYREGHAEYGRDVLIVGGGSGAADAALDLHRHGARVTMVHRAADFKRSLKYWVRPNLENRVKEGSIRALFHARVERIEPGTVHVVRTPPDAPEKHLDVPASRVLLLTGYRADPTLFAQAGARLDPASAVVEIDEATRETSVPGLYAIGSAGQGGRTSDVFIENGLPHARAAVAHVVERATAKRLAPATSVR